MGKKNRGKQTPTQATRAAEENTGLLRFIQQLMREQRFPEAIRAAQTLIENDPLNPASHAIMGSLLLQLNQAEDAMRRFEMAVRFGLGNDPGILRGLAVASTLAGYPVHGMQTARACLKHTGDEEQIRICGTIVAAGENVVRELIGPHPVSTEEGERALLLIEQSNRALRLEDGERAALRTVEATKAAPAWPFVWNNLATFRFGEGDIQGAIDACHEGERLASVPDPMLTLTQIRIASASGNQDEATSLTEALVADPAARGAGVGDVSRALAILGRDQEALDHLLPAFQAEEKLNLTARFVLGVAAANLGQPEVARAAWRNLAREGLGQVRQFSDILGRHEEPPTLDGRFPYLSAIELAPRNVLDTLFTEGQTNPDEVDMAAWVTRFPRLSEAICEPLFSPSVSARLTVELLLRLPTPAVAAVTRFAGSRNLTDHERLYAHLALRGSGQVDAAEPASVWIEGRRRDWLLPSLRLRPAPRTSHSEQILALLGEGHRAQERNDNARAIEIYTQVLELEPDSREAEHNLGTALMLSKRMEEGEGHLRRALEIDPDYVLARVNLAALELARGQLAAAHELLDPLDQRVDYALEEITAYLRVRADLAMADRDAARAEMLLHCLLAYDPDNSLARERLATLAQLVPTAG